jgi:hypothetical protein
LKNFDLPAPIVIIGITGDEWGDANNAFREVFTATGSDQITQLGEIPRCAP